MDLVRGLAQEKKRKGAIEATLENADCDSGFVVT
jgi:hypothetical protein